VDAVDGSPAAIAWARERAPSIRFHCSDIFAVDLPHDTDDLAYDTDCFHHLAPVSPRAPGTASPEPSCPTSSSTGMAACTAASRTSRTTCAGCSTGYREVELRIMKPDTGLFGEPFLLAGLFRRE
jgi:hypothetical protein